MVGRIILIVVIVILVFGGLMALMATRGLKKVKNLPLADIDISSIPDGVYEGSFSGYRWDNTLRVTVKDGKITDFEVVTEKMSKSPQVVNEIREKLIARQDLHIDAVSGASVNTRAYLKAIEDALQKAEK
jgi:uncharacterized protein with FMN-binding domain